MDKFTLHSFNSAKINISQIIMSPPIYTVTVEGLVNDFSTIIELCDDGQIENGYIVINVKGDHPTDIGTIPYKKPIEIQKIIETKGVIIKGENKGETLDWPKKAELLDSAATGLFLLALQSSSSLRGVPTVNLQLAIDTIYETVSGIDVIYQSTEQGTVSTSIVEGNFIYESVMKPGDSKIRIDVTGYPHIHWPKNGGVGPR